LGIKDVCRWAYHGNGEQSRYHDSDAYRGVWVGVFHCVEFLSGLRNWTGISILASESTKFYIHTSRLAKLINKP
jgi:hypothetical protein